MSREPSGGIRQAASVVVGREGEDGLEVLVLERGATSRFLPGYVAFPGGAIDERDTGLAARWFGSAAEAGRACAVRELVEEAGLALTAAGLVDAGTPDSLDPVDASPPAAGQLPQIARWIAPEEVPVRFDARYYAASAPSGLDPSPDGAEAAYAWWASPRSILEDWEAQRRKLFWPTYFTLTWLARLRSVDELMRLEIATREPGDRELELLHPSTFWQE